MENVNKISKKEKLEMISQDLDKMIESMLQKGLNHREINSILSTYKEFLDVRDGNDEKFIKANSQNYYSSEKVKNVCFKTKNEVKLLHCLNDINPNVKPDELAKMVGMIYHLLGVTTEWYTIPSPDKK